MRSETRRRLHYAVKSFEHDGTVAVLSCGHRRKPARGVPGQGKHLTCEICTKNPRDLRCKCGTKQMYVRLGCRCDECREAYVEWARVRRAAKRLAKETADRRAVEGGRVDATCG